MSEALLIEVSKHCMDRWRKKVRIGGGYNNQLRNICNYFSPEQRGSWLFYNEELNRYILSRLEINSKTVSLQYYLILEECEDADIVEYKDLLKRLIGKNIDYELYAAKTVIDKKIAKKEKEKLLEAKLLKKDLFPYFFYINVENIVVANGNKKPPEINYIPLEIEV